MYIYIPIYVHVHINAHICTCPYMYMCTYTCVTCRYSVADDVSVKTKVNKQRRAKVSCIPSQPVEMPSGIDTLNFEVSLCCH